MLISSNSETSCPDFKESPRTEKIGLLVLILSLRPKSSQSPLSSTTTTQKGRPIPQTDRGLKFQTLTNFWIPAFAGMTNIGVIMTLYWFIKFNY